MGWKHHATCSGAIMAAAVLAACASQELNGSGLPLNMQPMPPSFAGAYDFDLLGAVHGKACARRGYTLGGAQRAFWISGAGLERLTRDSLSSQAIGAAAFDAINGLTSVDTLVVTRVVTESKGPDEICANVYGRAIRLTKAMPPEPAAVHAPEIHKSEKVDDLANPKL